VILDKAFMSHTKKQIQELLERMNKYDGEVHGESCPECGKKDIVPVNPLLCQCPTMIVVPPGKHIHVSCPVHGQVVIHGNAVFC
jgi:hypothetical protein